jgi:hypothetical protein
MVRKKQRGGFPPPAVSDCVELQSFMDWKVLNKLPGEKKNIVTNCHVEQSPMGDTCP